MSRFLAPLAMLTMLSGCSAIGPAVGGAAMTALAPTIASAIGISATTLSEVAKAACGAQAAANVAKDVAVSRGSMVWAARFGIASQAAGLACAW